MKTRTTEKIVTFTRPFALAGLDDLLPAGEYGVETEEKLVEGSAVAAGRQTATLLRLRKRSGPFRLTATNLTQAIAVDPNELKAALKRDAQSAVPAAAAPHPAEADRAALDRADDEGMTAQPL